MTTGCPRTRLTQGPRVRGAGPSFRDLRGLWVRVARGGDPGLPSLLRLALRVPSWAYRVAVSTRNGMYRLGLRRRIRLPAPVISVGNLTAGGTGKTPVVEWLARRLLAQGRTPAVLSRGYRADGPGPDNDETRMLGGAVSGLIQVVGPDRVRAGRVAIEQKGADCLVLDDGFQHVRLARNLDIVTIDALDPFGGGRLLPAGALREPKRALRRAHVVVVTRADLASPGEVASLSEELRRLAPGALVVTSRFAPESLTPLDRGAALDPGWLAGRRAFAFCGVGAPEGFFRALERLAPASLCGVALDDHAAYPPDLLARLARQAESAEAEVAVVTSKDAVKIGDAWPGPMRALALKIRLEILQGEDLLAERLHRALSPASA